MKTLWLACVCATFFAVACGGEKKTPTDDLVIADNDTVSDEEPTEDADTPVTDTDTTVPETGPNGEQQWPGVLPTGQTRCYDNEKEIPCPLPGDAFYGQDPQFNEWKTRGFSTVDGVVFDDVTRLYWQAGYALDLTWAEAQVYCSGLSLAGKKWRLPTPHELKSLINYGKIVGDAPARPATDFPAETPVEWFWASGRTQDAATAWVVFFHDGYLEYTSRANYYAARCVATN